MGEQSRFQTVLDHSCRQGNKDVGLMLFKKEKAEVITNL